MSDDQLQARLVVILDLDRPARLMTPHLQAFQIRLREMGDHLALRDLGYHVGD
jgi:hypothetical protein